MKIIDEFFFYLHSIRTLILEDYPDQNVKFLKENDITLFQFGIAGNKVKHDGREKENACCFGHMWSRVSVKEERPLRKTSSAPASSTTSVRSLGHITTDDITLSPSKMWRKEGRKESLGSCEMELNTYVRRTL